MKKQSLKQWLRDVKRSISQRQQNSVTATKKKTTLQEWKKVNAWIDQQIKNGLDITKAKKNKITLDLPERMNFSKNYNETIKYITFIRKITERKSTPRKAYKLVHVSFGKLKEISTSAALVLTAELSKWDDSLRNNLKPLTENWNCNILQQFHDLGFFDLFMKKPDRELPCAQQMKDEKKLVKYIKGRCGDAEKAKKLKEEIINIVGAKTLEKWTFLYSGLSEAITNVSHHAYPETYDYVDKDKNWYLTGSFNPKTRALKIVFYDQGIGIPKSLPASKIWERVLSFFDKYAIFDRKKDEVLLKAAVELDRTSTNQNDRGKGLQDLLEFIRQKGDGYLSIISKRGLYKLTVTNGKETPKSDRFLDPLDGTLIIWNVTLND